MQICVSHYSSEAEETTASSLGPLSSCGVIITYFWKYFFN